MIFKTLVIENFGIYRGENHFDLRPYSSDDDTRPIILFGGKNGSGKTTILEAIRLCLYGRSALGNRVRKQDYDTYISQRLHRDLCNQKSQYAEIRLVFEHTHGGNRSVYEATRSWRFEGKNPEETVRVFKNSEPLYDIPPEHWDDFLRDLIPPGVADLFFFDGEQIQALANETTEAEALADAIRGLLNLELIERLQSDLSTYLRRQKNKKHSKLQQEAEKAEQRLEKIREGILELKQDRASLKTKIDHVSKRIESARQLLLREGGGFVEHQDKMIERRNFLDAEIDRVSDQIREMSAGLVPFALVPHWNERLSERFALEAEAKREKLTQEVLHSKAKEIVARLSAPEFKMEYASGLSDEGWHQLLLQIEASLTNPKSLDDIQLRHPISEDALRRIQNWMYEAMNDVPRKLHEMSIYLEKLETERVEVEKAIKQVPEQDVTSPLIDAFHKLANEEGSLNDQITDIDGKIKQLQIEEAEAERASKRAWKDLAQAAGIAARVERAAKAQVILDQYLERITAVKVGELQDQFVQYFKLLARKKNLVQSVVIDPQTFDVTLLGENNTEIPKTELSAGEKQLYAMALLWALRAVSGRALPIIMDTPMGRLDTDHRATLLENFFPLAAHQVIILSTDTEIDATAFNRIQHDVSRVYRLEYDEDKGYTEVIEGYFGEMQSEVAV
ncbi:MAG: DNA sulfur modification protein DndD [Chloroflexi bacterium]|nr:MAG: DNA sulfur modification protein DndD [Chloroflexota bacterium]